MNTLKSIYNLQTSSERSEYFLNDLNNDNSQLNYGFNSNNRMSRPKMFETF